MQKGAGVLGMNSGQRADVTPGKLLLCSDVMDFVRFYTSGGGDLIFSGKCWIKISVLPV